MAVSRIYPSSDLHLFPGAPPTPLRIFVPLDHVWTDLASQPDYSLSLTLVRPPPPTPPTQPIATLVSNAIVPGGEGEQLASLQVMLTPATGHRRSAAQLERSISTGQHTAVDDIA